MIKRQSSLYKIIYEQNGQKCFFGRDNLSFKTVNMPKPQRFDNICLNFKLKKLVKNISLNMPFIAIK